MARGVYVCSAAFLLLQLLSLSASVTFRPPPLRYNISTSSVWKCFHNLEPSQVHHLLAQFAPTYGGSTHDRSSTSTHSSSTHSISESESYDGLEIVHTQARSVEIVSSEATVDALRVLGIGPCSKMLQMRDLVEAELKENLESMQNHVSKDDLEWILGEGEEIKTPVWGRSHAGGMGREVRSAGDEPADEEQASRKREGVRRLRTGRRREAKVKEQRVRDVTKKKLLGYKYDRYLNSSTLKAWWEELVAAHPDTISLHPSIGRTHYERDIFALHITHKESLRSSKPKPRVYIQCLIHPREWITGPVCMYIAQNLVENDLYSSLLRQVEVVMVPIANPDGYFVTWYRYPKYRLWRKNASPMEGSKCMGVDLNRNFDSHWNMEASSHSPDVCSELYAGPKAESELEVQAVTRYLKSLGHTLVGVMDVHSYYQEVVYPPAWSKTNPQDIAMIRSVAESVAGSMSEVGAPYTARRMVDIYSASGTLMDWLLDEKESGEVCSSLIPLTVELRPAHYQVKTTSEGFLLPAAQIYPTCVEVLAGFTHFVEHVLDTGRNCYSLYRPSMHTSSGGKVHVATSLKKHTVSGTSAERPPLKAASLASLERSASLELYT